jgi:hypothetical protein
MSESVESAPLRLRISVAPSPLFGDPWRRKQFHGFLSEFIDICEDVKRDVELPGFVAILDWKVNSLRIAYEHLRRHVVAAREKSGPCVWHDPPGKDLYSAYQWMCSLLFANRGGRPHPWDMDSATLRKLEWLPNDRQMDTLRRIRDLVPADEPEAFTGPRSGPSPSVGTDGRTDRTEAAADRQAPPPEGEPPAAGPAGEDRKNTNAVVNAHLQRDPKISAAAISRATGIPAPTVRNSRAWRTHQARLQQEKRESADAMDHARPLTAPMLAAIDSEAADPAELAAERENQDDPEVIEPTEVLRRRYLEGATADQRAQFHRLNSADQEHELSAWEVTGARCV